MKVKLTDTERQQYGGYYGKGGGVSKTKGGKIHGDGRWFDFGGGHTMPYTHQVS